MICPINNILTDHGDHSPSNSLLDNDGLLARDLRPFVDYLDPNATSRGRLQGKLDYALTAQLHVLVTYTIRI